MDPIRTFRDRKLSLWQSAVEEVTGQASKVGLDAARAQPQAVATTPPADAPHPATYPAAAPALATKVGMDAAGAEPKAVAATALADALHEATSPAAAPSLATVPPALAASGVLASAWRCNKLALQLAWAKLQGDTHAVEQLQQE